MRFGFCKGQKVRLTDDREAIVVQSFIGTFLYLVDIMEDGIPTGKREIVERKNMKSL